VSDDVIKELDTYIASGKGKEIWDEVAKTDITLYNVLSSWKKLWPFKRPSSPNGFWIFDGALATKEYWERVIMTILVKSPETFKDWYKFLNNQGMAVGLPQIIATKLFSMFIVLPGLETIFRGITSFTEAAYNTLADDDVNWVDYEGWRPDLSVNLTNNLYTQIMNSEWGELIDDRTWADEFAHIMGLIWDLIEIVVGQGENYEGFEENEQRIQTEIENMSGVPDSVINAVTNQQIPGTSNPTQTPQQSTGVPSAGNSGGPPGTGNR
jgi:hypothetical protein